MARSKLTETINDLITDSGAVLWSFIRGEQLEYSVTLSNLGNILNGYTFEAVIIEADNIESQDQRPVTVKSNGKQVKLTVRVPKWRGQHDALGRYEKNDLVRYGNSYYVLSFQTAYTSNLPPNEDIYWTETTPNVVYVQFPSTLGADWTVKATVGSPVYGFFELRVTEPLVTGAFQRTWKPVRGMVELHFSPTDVVPD